MFDPFLLIILRHFTVVTTDCCCHNKLSPRSKIANQNLIKNQILSLWSKRFIRITKKENSRVHHLIVTMKPTSTTISLSSAGLARRRPNANANSLDELQASFNYSMLTMTRNGSSSSLSSTSSSSPSSSSPSYPFSRRSVGSSSSREFLIQTLTEVEKILAMDDEGVDQFKDDI